MTQTHWQRLPWTRQSDGRSVARGVAVTSLALALGLSGAARAARPAPCSDGFFTVQGTPFVIDGSTTDTAQIALAGGTLRLLGVCTSGVTATVKAGKRATKLVAVFRTCGGRFSRATLKASLRAPDCGTVKGVLLVKGAKPRRRPFTATRVVPSVLAATLRSETVQARMANENLPHLVRLAAEPLNPEVTQLVAFGPSAVDALVAQFDGIATLPDDVPLALFAVALERLGDPRAIPPLATWLERNLFSMVLVADELVTHTLKVLAGHSDRDDVHVTYDLDEKLDTLTRVRGAATAPAIPPTFAPRLARPIPPAATRPPAPAPAASITDARNKCEKQLRIVGLNAQGQQETVTIGYKTVFYDLQEQIDLEDDPQRRAALQALQARYRRDDEAFYGGTDYRSTGDVGVQSNCGGSVTERMLNAVAAQRGFPIRLGAGNCGADEARDLARRFGGPIGPNEIDPYTVIAHEREDGTSAHVEIPVAVNGNAAVVYSKDNQGAPRLHTVARGGIIGTAANFFGPVQQRYNFKPFSNYAQTTPTFSRIDPARIVAITLDSSGCPCDFAFGGVVPVTITQPTANEVSERVVTVAGTIGDPTVTDGTLRLNGSPQGIDLSSGGFSSQVVLRSGENTLRVAVEAPDGRRGCAERTLTSTTPKTTLSATLTWNLDATDVDLYVTQPNDETAWYSNRTTTIGGRLDVDDTSGFGPENYFLRFDEGTPIVAGSYVVRVHYFRDHLADTEHPPRVVTWRLVVIVNEGTPAERREIATGTLTAANSANDRPGSAGPDWAAAATVALTP